MKLIQNIRKVLELRSRKSKLKVCARCGEYYIKLPSSSKTLCAHCYRFARLRH
jgi:formylmethanofuran dehydrogenase subunit E